METFDNITCEEFYNEEVLQLLEEMELDYVNGLLQIESEEYKFIDI
jgi:hypothetical protein